MESPVDINIFVNEDNHVVEKIIDILVQEIWVSNLYDGKVNEIN